MSGTRKRSPLDLVVGAMRAAQIRREIPDADLADPGKLPFPVHKAGSIAAYEVRAACGCSHDQALGEAVALFRAAVRVLVLSNGWRP